MVDKSIRILGSANNIPTCGMQGEWHLHEAGPLLWKTNRQILVRLECNCDIEDNYNATDTLRAPLSLQFLWKIYDWSMGGSV